MWILKEAENKRRQTMQKVTSEVTPKQVQPVTWVETPMWYTSLRNDITSVDTLQERNAARGVSDLIKHRINLRKWISDWTVSSWNEAADYLTMRKSGLVDIFSDYMMQDKNIIKSDTDASALQNAIKTDPDSIINYFKQKVIWEWNPEWIEAKNKAIDDYIMKWWKLNDVMDFITEKNATPYWTPKEEKLEWTNPILNFLWSVVSTPIREIWWLSQIVWDKLWLTSSAEEAARKTATVQWASTQWYNEYKKSWKLPSEFSEDYANLYKWYDDAVKDWFIGSVEEYNNYLWDIAVATDKTFKQLTDDFTEKYLFNPEEAWAEPWNVVWDILEIIAAELGTMWAATPELAATKLPKYYKYAKWLYQSLKWWAEFQALEDAYEWELSDVPEYVQSAATNTILKWWLESLWKLWRLSIWKLAKTYWWITERWEVALAWETPTSSAEKIKIIKESKWTNPIRTPEKEMWNSFLAARKAVKEWTDDKIWVDELYKKKREYEKNFKGEWDGTEIIDELNTQMEKYLNPEEMWEQTAKVAPKFRLWESREEELLRKKAERDAAKTTTKDAEAEASRLESLTPEERAEELELKWLQEETAAKKAAEQERARKYELKVDDKELLESWYSKDKVDLINVLVNEWNKMFVKAWRELNDSNIWELSKLIESKSAWTEWTKDIVEALKKVMWRLQKSMWPEYEKISKEYWAKKDILEWLDNVLWNLTRRTSDVWTEVWLSEAWEKVLKWVSREQLSQLNKYFWINLNREVDSWIIHLAIYDPEKAAELAKNIYPSLPWVLELLINGGKMVATKRAAKDIVQKNAPEMPEKTSVWDAIWRSVRWKTAEWLVDFWKRF